KPRFIPRSASTRLRQKAARSKSSPRSTRKSKEQQSKRAGGLKPLHHVGQRLRVDARCAPARATKQQEWKEAAMTSDEKNLAMELLDLPPEKLRRVLRSARPEDSEREIEEIMEDFEMVQWLLKAAPGCGLEDIQRLAAEVELRRKPQ